MTGLIAGALRRCRLFLTLILVAGAVSGCATSGSGSIEEVVAPVAPTTEKYAAIVVDAKSGQMLYGANATELRYPASLTKMMTVYMLFEAMDQGRISRTDLIPISPAAAARPPSKLGLKPGQSIPVDTAIRVLVVKSANDVATAVAEFLGGGSEARFAEMMTMKARALGMSRTTFKNASGLPDPGQVTTAADMARLSILLRRNFPHYYGYFGQTEVTIGGTTIKGHNKAMEMIPGADGLKTGYTRASGFNLATSVTQGGKSVVGVVMGEDTAAIRNARMAQLMSMYVKRAQ
ncbi:MAG: D-alanyl-D-alanine carboxypeptidase family protein [Hoeflea sp.]|uniref:D-alanyl-D-alanine carboxypeptidase family protein n=1 Tax=Hoeflea sp. TaxID=1940281 RepID=UPI00272FEBEF|nr:D-alanyl-D-alanine carboxypeptidase family protein [Hoeflea sp.]MDP2120035.1 D-alanyl-D-alanine carboxypeptidase family protein [Hoeflea sp.]MDZ7602023.1 D-alanyl-D-alanine carboxypeptidase family protein [Hoeflea sp.]